MVDILKNGNGVWKPLTSERRRKWRQDAMEQVFLLSANAQGRDTINCQVIRS